ncbi:MAG: thermonuclease family protein [Pseudomonadota bacterium]
MGRRRRHTRTHRHRRGRGFVTTLALFALLVGAIVWLDGSNRQNFTGAAIAVDGDSLQMGGKRLRLSGIDAPELAQTCDVAGRLWPCGRQARASLRRLIAKDLSCTTTGLDRYDRHLVRCTAGGKDIGAAMVAAGMAVSYGAYGAQEAAARAAKRGLWRGNFTRPQAWREANNQRDEQTGAVLRNGFDRLRHWGQTVLNRFMKWEG